MKKRIVLRFPAEHVDEPITCNLIRNYDIIVNILNADISHGREGNLLVEMNGLKTNLDKAIDYLESKKIGWSPVAKNILYREEDCVHCGTCSSVCFSGALVMKSPERKLQFFPEKCIACELCIKACPLQLFELNFGVH